MRQTRSRTVHYGARSRRLRARRLDRGRRFAHRCQGGGGRGSHYFRARSPCRPSRLAGGCGIYRQLC